MILTKSIGNDIVALKATHPSRADDVAFYSKILSVSEQELYRRREFEGMSFGTFVWLLWSVKESGFKYLKRTIPDLVFSPAKIIIRQIDPPSVQPIDRSGGFEWECGGNAGSAGACGQFYRGAVLFGSIPFYFRSKIHPEWIATVVGGTENFENTWWGVKPIEDPGYASQSSSARAFVVNKLLSVFSRDNLRIAKDPVGCPIVLDGEEQMDVPVSLAHHGRFVAYSFSVADRD